MMFCLSRSASLATLWARRRALVAATPLMLAACIEEDATSPDAARPQWTAASLPEDSLIDDPGMLAVAKEIQAFAGYWFDDQGQLVVAMTDMSRAGEAERAVRSRIGSHESRAGHVDGTSVRIVTRSATYSFLDLVRYKIVLRPHVFAIEGVATLDANEVKNRVEIGVVTSSAEGAVRSTLAKLGIPEDAVVFSRSSYPRPATTNQDWAGEIYGESVVQGGWQIESASSGWQCTLGFAAHDPGTGAARFITNSHCTAFKWGYDGASFGQPGELSTQIGYEIADPIYMTGSFNCGLLSSDRCRYSDAALFAATKPILLGTIVRLADSTSSESFSSSLVVDGGPLQITSVRYDNSISGEILHKIGRTTGWTYGEVESTCEDANIPFWPDDKTLCSDRVDFHVEDGDSGSPAFKVKANGTVELRGIVWGDHPVFSDGYLSPMWAVRQELGNLVYFDPGQPFVTITGPTQAPGMGIQCSWEAAVTSGGLPPLTYQWSGMITGTGAGITGPVYTSGGGSVTVTDFKGRQATAYWSVEVVPGLPPLCE